MRRRFETRRNLKRFAVSPLVIFYLETLGPREPCWSRGGGGGTHSRPGPVPGGLGSR